MSPAPDADARSPRPGRPAVAPAVVPPEQALRRMVGAAVDGSLDELRTAYDLAVHRATRAGDHQHALALSRAYDRLPVTTRQRLYPSSRTTAGHETPSRRPGRTRAGAPSGRRARRRRRTFRVRLLVYPLLGLVTIGLVAAGAVQHYREHRATQPAIVRPAFPTAPTAGGAVAGGAVAPVIVPTSAPTGANGLVTLLCRPATGVGGYAMTAPRGTVVACSNGATPTVVG